MLEIRFSHTGYAKMPPGGVRPFDQTILLNYCVVHELSQEFKEFDTKYYPPGKEYEKHAKFFPLAEGPYLILFLKTILHPPNKLLADWYWTTVRRPWCRLPADERGKTIPKKYREARGKFVRITFIGE